MALSSSAGTPDGVTAVPILSTIEVDASTLEVTELILTDDCH